MGTINDALRTLKTLRPPRIAAGLEISKITEAVTCLDVWGLLEAVRVFVDLTADHKIAIERLKEFVTNPGPLKFTKLDRAKVTLQALSRVLNHGLVDQMKFGICGPAAIAMETAANRPAEYIKLIVFLCDSGECQFRHLKLKPGPEILNYDPGTDMPQADWVVCASLRDDSKSLQAEFSKETYGGSTVEEVYEWMIKAGYTKVIGINSQPLATFCKMHPGTIKPPIQDPSDKLKALKIAIDLSSKGWHVFLAGYMSLTHAIKSLHKVQSVAGSMEDDEQDIADMMMKNTQKAETKKLLTPNPGALGIIAETAKVLILKQSPADERHWVYVEKLKYCSVDSSYLTVTCCTHGVRYSSTNVPLEGFLNKYLGYVAVTDLY